MVVGATTIEADLSLAGSAQMAHVTFEFTDPDIVKTTFSLTGGSQVFQGFTDQGENIYGVWAYPFGGGINCRGTDKEFLGFQHETGINYSSVRAPFYVTDRNYGLYAQSEAQGHFTTAVSGSTSFSFDAPDLTYYIIHGESPKDILTHYNTIAGGSFMPPTWAFSTIWWTNDDHLGFHGTVSNAQENVIDTADKLRDNQIPASGIWIDRPYGTSANGWGNADFDGSFPNPAQMVSDLQARGINLLLWVSNRAYSGTTLHTDANTNGWLFPTVAPEGGGGSGVDVRIPAAETYFKNHLDTFANLGVKGYKIDRGDEKEMPDDAENETVTAFHKLTYDGLESDHPGDHFSFARDLVDTGRKYVAAWNGDPDPTFTGMRYSLMSGLRSGLMNFPVWCSDTGGYSGAKPTEEVFARWFGFSAYTPIMEVMIGDTSSGGRTPWYDYSAALVDIAREQSAAHHDLIPYSRSLVYSATQDGVPPMRAMFLEHPEDPAVANMWDQYFYGPDLLVAPVTTSGATSRSVYLPAGTWMDYNTRSAVYAGSASLTASAPLDTIPLFVREGAIIPRGDILQANNNWTASWSPGLRIEFFPSDTVPSSFDYYTGTGVETIHCGRSGTTLTIQFGNLDHDGTLEIHLNSAGSVTRNGMSMTAGVDYTWDAATHVLQVPFSGATTLVIDDAFGLFSPVDIRKTEYFGDLSDPAVSGDLADPDGDGIPTLVELALGENPLVVTSPADLTDTTILTESENDFFALVYQRVKEPSGLTFTVEVSNELSTWNSGPAFTENSSVIDLGTLDEVTEKVLAPMSETNASFVRLRIDRQ